MQLLLSLNVSAFVSFMPNRTEDQNQTNYLQGATLKKSNLKSSLKSSKPVSLTKSKFYWIGLTSVMVVALLGYGFFEVKCRCRK